MNIAVKIKENTKKQSKGSSIYDVHTEAVCVLPEKRAKKADGCGCIKGCWGGVRVKCNILASTSKKNRKLKK